MIDNSRSCFHGNVIFGRHGPTSLSSNKPLFFFSPPNGSRERGGWPVGTWFSYKTPNSINWGHFYPVVDMMQLTICRNSAAVSLAELDAEYRLHWRNSFFFCLRLSASRLEISLNSQPKMSERDTGRHAGQERWRCTTGARGEAPGLILHLDRFTFWLPEKTWTWGIGRRPINSIQPRQRVSGPHAGVNQDDLMRKTLRPGPQSEWGGEGEGGGTPAPGICDAPTSCGRRLSE